MSNGFLTQGQADEIISSAPLLANSINKLTRNSSDSLDAYFITIDTSTLIEGTKTIFRCHYLRKDAQGNIRINDLARKVRHHIVDYCIPRSEIARAMTYYQDTNSTEEFSKLESRARTLFTKLKTTGEGGEILLYLLMDSLLNVPQLMCKMSLKTNSQVHYHGVDGIHGTLNPETGNLAIYWGEAKLYQDVSAAVRRCFDSIVPYLKESGGSGAAQERDIQLLRDNIDLGNPSLEEALKKYLNPDDPLFLKLEYRAACLVGFNYASYPDPFEDQGNGVLCAQLTDSVNEWRQLLSEVLTSSDISAFVIETFFVPFPSVQDFRSAFLQEIGGLSGD